jgi:lysozyme family protein
MAASSYDAALTRLLAHEGGYTNHPADPGGPTNFGITISDYRKYVKPDATAADVKAMTVEEAKAIYRRRYWDALRCDDLPAGVDYAVFDYGVNSGVGRAGRVLRRCLNLPDDTSRISNEVIAAAGKAETARLIAAICDERIVFLQSLKTWDVFGKGWSRRVAEVRAAALTMAVTPDASPRAVPAVAAAGAASAGGAAHAYGLSGWVVLALLLAAAIGGAAWFLANGRGSGMWAAMTSSFKNSLTILWARIVALAGVLLALCQSLLADPAVDAAIRQAMQPQYIPYYAIAIGLVTEFARRRTAGKA